MESKSLVCKIINDCFLSCCLSFYLYPLPLQIKVKIQVSECHSMMWFKMQPCFPNIIKLCNCQFLFTFSWQKIKFRKMKCLPDQGRPTTNALEGFVLRNKKYSKYSSGELK